MIIADFIFDTNDVIQRCTVHGHAAFNQKGSDVVCAAVSILIRTAVSLFTNHKGITVENEAPGRGIAWFQVKSVNTEKEFVKTVGIFLFEGVCSVVQEYPERCTVRITKIQNS
ncbi:MAG: ribosomal-processing cysteine protease Prp [Treponema sp.]|jgi:uncharacterized protein YsxB (DUF464 family)|nr:ribosomal-processing cysteine protease Prp [Treponema sp.]